MGSCSFFVKNCQLSRLFFNNQQVNWSLPLARGGGETSTKERTEAAASPDCSFVALWNMVKENIWQVLLNFQTTDNTDIDCSGSDRISPRQNKVAQLSDNQQIVADRDKTITNIIFSDLEMI